MDIYISENIKRLRKQNNLTQEQLAAIFNVSTAAVCKWELGETYPDITLIPEIAYYFNVTLDEIMGYDISKIEEEISKIIKEYDAISNQEKYKGTCDLINNARRKYPHDCRILERYIFDKVGGYADNDPLVLIENSVEIMDICNDIKNNTKDIKILINALTLEAKVLFALGKKDDAICIIDSLPSIYHSLEQRKEQLFNKNSMEYYNTLNENLGLVGELFGDKLAKAIIFNNDFDKSKKIELLEELISDLKNLDSKFKYFNSIFKPLESRLNQYLLK